MSLVRHLERKRLDDKQREDKAKAAASGVPTAESARDPIVVRHELLSVVDAWMANSASLVRAPERAVDIMQQAVDGRAGLGATYNSGASAVRVVSDDNSSKALDSSVTKLKRRIALDEDDVREDQRFASHQRAPDDDGERGRSDAVVSRKRVAVGGPAAAASIVNNKLLARREKKKRKKLAQQQQAQQLHI
jgi:hypothetical protein